MNYWSELVNKMKLLLKKYIGIVYVLAKKNVWAISTIDFKTTKWWHFFRILILWPAYSMTCLQGLLNLIYTYNIILIFGDITGIWELGINCWSQSKLRSKSLKFWYLILKSYVWIFRRGIWEKILILEKRLILYMSAYL